MRASKLFPPAALLTLILSHPAMAQTLPSGGTVVSGAANIQQNGANQTITQTSQKAIINWQNFSIGAGGSVNFEQPNSSSVVLNRVTGNARSEIYGKLTANGQVFIVNPNGVYFGAGSSVDVGGLLATTLGISDNDFLSGNYVFTRGSADAARRDVINEGVLKARDNGYVVLAGDYAANRGIVQAKLGTVALASGSKMTLDVQGDSLINFAVNEKTVAQLSGLENSGQLLADGGRAIMTAAVATDLQTAVVNNSGLVRANTAEERNGEIILSADGGNTQNSGTLDASGKALGQSGGTIQVLGNKVALTDNAVLDASGDAGGGTINVGGNYQGKGPLKNAQTNYVGQNVQIKADALSKGNGGNIVVWSDDWTRYYGSISAKGGAQGGDGGNVEVSGKQLLAFNGKVNTLAAKGKAGTLLLDPADIEIINSNAVSGGTPTSDMSPPSAPGSPGDTIFKDASNNGGTSQMAVGVLEDALQQGNVTVQTSTGTGTAPKGGTITIDDGSGNGVQWTKDTQLHLKADNQIIIKSDVQNTNGVGSLWLEAVNGATQNSNTNMKAGSLLLTDGANGTGSWTLVGKGNNFTTFAANLSTSGTLQFQNNQGMTVGSVTKWDSGTTIDGIQHANGETQLNVLNGGLSLAKDINSKKLYINNSSLTQQAGQKITGDNLMLTGGTVTLTNAGNNFKTISAYINGTLAYTDADSLTVGTYPNVFSGIFTFNHDVTIKSGNSAAFTDLSQQPTASTASLVLNESINAGLGTVRLTAGNGGIYQRHDTNSSGAIPNGSITANALLVQGDNTVKANAGKDNVTPFVLTNSANRINTFAAKANGSISLAGAASNSSHTLTIGTIDSVSGITTTSNTTVSSTTNPDGSITSSTNENNISLSIGGNLNIDKNLTASTATGTDTVSIGIGGDFTARTASGVKVTADTMGLFGDDMQGTFSIVSNVQNLAAAGGKIMVIDNTAYTGTLAGIGIGASATTASATNGGSTVSVNSSDKPVGDFYLATGGGLNIIKLNSKGQNLMLRSTSLSILLEAITADNARIMLQPLNSASTIGISNSTEPGWTPGINYDANTLLKFSNPVSTFYFGTPSNAILNDINVPNFARNISTGDIHIGYDGAFNLGYRSISAQTSGNMVAYNVGPLYNLRLAAPNLTIYKFNTFGDQIHLFTNNLSLPNSVNSYVNPYKPTITLRSLDDQTIWVGHSYVNNEKQFLPSQLVKLPDGSTIVIGGSTDYPFPNGGAGYGDIHVTWDDGIVLLGNRKLVLSTQHTIYDYNATPAHTEDHSGTAGGLWKGCQNLTTCAGTNPSPYPDPGGGTVTPGNGDNSGGGSSSSGSDGGCKGCPSADPNTNPYPPNTSTGDNNNGNGNGSTGNNTNGNGTGDDGTGANSDGGGDDGGGLGDGGNGDGNNGAGSGGDGSGNNGDGTGDNGAGIGSGGDGTGDNGSGLNGGGNGDGNNGAGSGGDGSGNNGDGAGDNGAGIGSGGDGTGDNGSGLNGGGNGDGNNGAGSGGDGSGNNGDGTGDSGAGTGSGGNGTGDNGSGLGDGGNGDGNNGGGTGDDGSGLGDNGAGNGGAGAGNSGDGSGDGGAGTGSGGAADGSDGNGLGNGDGGDGGGGNGSGDNGNANGDAGAGNGSGGTGDGADGRGDGDDGNGLGDDNAGDTGTGNGASGDGDSGAGSGSGGLSDNGGANGEGDGATGTGNGDDRQGGGAQGGGDGDGQSGAGDGGERSSNADASSNFDISCADIAQTKDKKTSDRKGGKELVEVKQQGLKLRDPCQQQPMPDKR